MQGFRQQSFTVPGGAGTLATEVLYLTFGELAGLVDGHGINEISVTLDGLVATAVVELDLFRPGFPAVTTDSSWILTAESWNTAGLQPLLQLAGWFGARIRVRSGGTGGTQVVAVKWR